VLLPAVIGVLGAAWSVSSASGDGAIVLSLRADLATTLDPANLPAEAALERRIAALPGVSSVTGPASFIEQSARRLNREIASEVAAMHPSGAVAARKALATALVHYGYVGLPSLANQSFIGQLVFGSGTMPERRFAWLFPDEHHARVVIHPRGSEAQGLRAEIGRLLAGAQLQGVQVVLQ
jgi:hypothetical protein